MEKIFGKIYKNEEIEALYGTKKHSVFIETDVLRKAAEQATNCVYFNIQGGNVIVAKSCEHFIQPAHFHMFSKSVVQEFLEKIGADKKCERHTELKIHDKDDTFVITNGKYSLQRGGHCPPDCD